MLYRFKNLLAHFVVALSQLKNLIAQFAVMLFNFKFLVAKFVIVLFYFRKSFAEFALRLVIVFHVPSSGKNIIQYGRTLILAKLTLMLVSMIERKRKVVETKKKRVIKSADVHFSTQKQVKTTKRSSRPQVVVCIETFQTFSWKNDLTYFFCS